MNHLIKYTYTMIFQGKEFTDALVKELKIIGKCCISMFQMSVSVNTWLISYKL